LHEPRLLRDLPLRRRSLHPLSLCVLSGHGSTGLLIVIWTLAAAGIALQGFVKLAHPLLSTGFYLAMG
jgi:predicted membrane channel-forming protein YqfA (hemolysin III family)